MVRERAFMMRYKTAEEIKAEKGKDGKSAEALKRKHAKEDKRYEELRLASEKREAELKKTKPKLEVRANKVIVAPALLAAKERAAQPASPAPSEPVRGKTKYVAHLDDANFFGPPPAPEKAPALPATVPAPVKVAPVESQLPKSPKQVWKGGQWVKLG